MKHGDSKTSVFYTHRFFFKANNSVNSQQMRKIFNGVNQGTMFYRFMKKIRDKKSHATVPLREQYHKILNTIRTRMHQHLISWICKPESLLLNIFI